MVLDLKLASISCCCKLTLLSLTYPSFSDDRSPKPPIANASSPPSSSHWAGSLSSPFFFAIGSLPTMRTQLRRAPVKELESPSFLSLPSPLGLFQKWRRRGAGRKDFSPKIITAICQTIEMKDLKGFYSISTASFVVWIDFSAHNYLQTLQDLCLGFLKRPYF